MSLNSQSSEEPQDSCAQRAASSKDRDSSSRRGALRAGAFGTFGRGGGRSLRSLGLTTLGRTGNRGCDSAGSRLSGYCGSRGEDRHAQREDAEELHFVGSGSLGCGVLIEWSRVVERKGGIVVVVVKREGLF